MFWRILRALRHYPARPAAVLTFAGTDAVLLHHYLHVLHLITTVLTVVSAAGLAVVSGWWFARRLAPAVSTGGWVARRDDASQHSHGVASWLDIGEHAGPSAIRARAGVLRPSLAGNRWWRRARLRDFAVLLVRTSWLPAGSQVYSTCEDVTMRIGGPRSGKSGSLACHALDAPGALLVTTSRTDLLDLTGPARARTGRVDVFNPTGIGRRASTVRWSPLAGCTSLGTAQRRAGDLIPASSGEGERWDIQARGLLTVLMHAAALTGGTMRTVLDWISPADVIARDQILAALRLSPTPRPLMAEIRSVYGTNDRTLTSITATLLPAIRWLTDETAVAVGDAPLDHPEFLDVEALVAGGRDSLYLIGREGPCRALIGALTAEVAHQVRMTAAGMPAGRLDPPMTAVLDEAPLTCGPIPLHDWTSDMGGRGFTLHIAGQSLAQFRDVWGENRAAAILGNVAALLVFGNLKTKQDLEDVSVLCGVRMVQLDPDDVRPVPVMTPAEIGQLPPETAVVIRNTLRPVVGRAPMAWDRSTSWWERLSSEVGPRVAAALEQWLATRRHHRQQQAGQQTGQQTGQQGRPVPAPARVIDLTGLDTGLEGLDGLDGRDQSRRRGSGRPADPAAGTDAG